MSGSTSRPRVAPAKHWRYANYVELDPGPEKLRRLRKHVHEVTQAMGGDLSHNVEGWGYTREGLTQLRAMLREEMKELEADLGIRRSGSGLYRTRLGS